MTSERPALGGGRRVSSVAMRIDRGLGRCAAVLKGALDARRPTLYALVLLSACAQADRPRGELRFWTERYALRVSSTPSPPRARARTLYRVELRNKESGRPMEKAEGQIYASNSAGRNIYTTLTPGPELGTYYGTLNFITAEEWALNLRFRGAPGDTIETVSPDGWRQVVAAPAP